MGQTVPALCTHCGGIFVHEADKGNYRHVMLTDPRAEEAGKRALDVAGKDPGKGHFIISIVKSAIRIVGCLALIFTGSLFAAGVTFLIAEVLGILEEIVD